jgi:peptidoglycan hydrolase-like protein with peptidoglycan-binding domain
MKHLNKLNNKGIAHVAILLVVIVGVAAIGTYMLVASRAATCRAYTWSVGKSNVCVQEIQRITNAAGARHWHYAGSAVITTDGSFGPMTKAQVVAFQRFGRLSADGVVGPNTWTALCAYARLLGAANDGYKAAAVSGCVFSGAPAPAPKPAPAPAATGGVATGTNSQLAQRILSYRSSGRYRCDASGDCTDLQKVINGQTLAGSQGCIARTLDARVLKMMLYTIEVGRISIGTFAMCGDHSATGNSGHSAGTAVDISSVNGVGINQNTALARNNALTLDRFLNALPPSIRLNQQISYGYGNHYDATLASTQQASSRLCGGSCVGFYGLGTEQQHMNHVHAGY